MTKLTWVEKFITKELYAPYVVKRDEDYYKDLKMKYRIFYNAAKKAGADEESLKIIKKFSETVKESIRLYYSGSVSRAHNRIKKLVKE